MHCKPKPHQHPWLRRSKALSSGSVWHSYYHNGHDDKRSLIEVSLGSELREALRRWAELEVKPTPATAGRVRKFKTAR